MDTTDLAPSLRQVVWDEWIFRFLYRFLYSALFFENLSVTFFLLYSIRYSTMGSRTKQKETDRWDENKDKTPFLWEGYGIGETEASQAPAAYGPAAACGSYSVHI